MIFPMFRFATFCSLTCTLGLAVGSLHAAAPYSGPTDTTHPIDPAIASDSGVFVEWADAIDETRTDFAPEGSTSIDESGGFNSLGELTQDLIDAGEQPGFLTVTFPTGIRNGEDADFAVFENAQGLFGGENDLFVELAYVEVSTDGESFARFPSIYLNEEDSFSGTRAFAEYDVTNIFNLAGKHRSGFGTPFDLDDLLDDPLVTSGEIDLDNIQFVKLVDIPGSGDFVDSEGNPIYDAWPTVGTGGFDFRLSEGQSVGVLNAVPEPASLVLFAAGLSLVAGRRGRGGRSR
ncbi:MAG: PEP-CTERM sorting domain-containing protein [Phycisphaeraceae bacterium]